MGKGTKKDSRKRTYSEDDELDPMDPSSYSDAPRGGWLVHCILDLYFPSILFSSDKLYP